MSGLVLEPDWFSKPGDSLVSAMRRRGLTAKEVAAQLSGGLDQLRGYVTGSLRIDVTSASSLASAVGGSPGFWLKRQANYDRDLERAAEAVPAEEADIWLTDIPVPGPKPRGRRTADQRRSELQRRLAFFGVSTLGAWERRYGADRHATRFRTSKALASSDGAVSLWLRLGELEAALADTAPWDAQALKARLPDIIGLSRIAKPDRFLPQLKLLLSEAGAALVIHRTPQDCRASGASRLVRPDKAMILLSFRHRSDDQFWFTVFHEIGHLLLHGGLPFVDGDDTVNSKAEDEANEFAVNAIIPPNLWGRFEEIGNRHKEVTRFAVSAGVSPGLILGQLQHQGRVAPSSMSFLRRHWTWEEIDAAVAIL